MKLFDIVGDTGPKPKKKRNKKKTTTGAGGSTAPFAHKLMGGKPIERAKPVFGFTEFTADGDGDGGE